MVSQYLVTYLLCTALAAPAPPQDEPNSEVEFVPVEELPALDEPAEKDPVVIVIKPSSFLPRLPELPQIPGFGEFPILDGFGSGLMPNFGELPRLPELFPETDPQIPRIDFGDIFGNGDKENGTRCGLLCKVFKNFEGQIKATQDAVDEIKSKIDGIDHHNSTFDQKVLPDGSVLHINRTTIHDSDEKGNGFFFHSSVHHVVNDGMNKTAVNETIPEDTVDVATIGETEEDNYDDILDILDQDEKENEIEVDRPLPPILDVSDIVNKNVPDKATTIGLVE